MVSIMTTSNLRSLRKLSGLYVPPFCVLLQRNSTKWLLDPSVHMFPCREYIAALGRAYPRYDPAKMCLRSNFPLTGAIQTASLLTARG